MKLNPILLFCGLVLMTSCGVFRKKVDAPTRLDNRSVSQIIQTARKQLGAPYQFGGTGNVGFDCSGLVTVAYNSAGFKLPRVSADMAEVGRKLEMREIRSGDLLFFITSTTNPNRINHVGIVTERRSDADIQFIHAADSGVKEDNLFSKYYQKAFVRAMRPF